MVVNFVPNTNALNIAIQTISGQGGRKSNLSKLEVRDNANAGFQVGDIVLWSAGNIYDRKMSSDTFVPVSLVTASDGRIKELYISQLTRTVIPTDRDGNAIEFEGEDRVVASGSAVDVWVSYAFNTADAADKALDGAYIRISARRVVPCMRRINNVSQYGSQVVYNFDIVDPADTTKVVSATEWLAKKAEAEKPAEKAEAAK